MANRLSVCLIARDEAVDLPRALETVREVADELVVVDTGSRDATPEIARRAGAVVGHFPWCDDFSAARNAALELASGDWILWLDADEALLPDSVPALREALQEDGLLAALVLRRDRQSADDPSRFSLMGQWRLFRNRPDLRFVGRCHPRFNPSLEHLARQEGRRLRQVDVVLDHRGYLPDRLPAKLARGRRLLELELQERPGQLYYLVELYRTHLLLGEKAEAQRRMLEAAGVLLEQSAARDPVGGAALLLETLLQFPPDRLPPGWSASRVQHLAARWYPDAPPLLWFQAQQAFAQGRFTEAESWLRRLVAMGTTHRYDRTASFDPRIIGDDARLNLAGCLVRLNRIGEAREIFGQLAAGSTRKREAEANLRALAAL